MPLHLWSSSAFLNGTLSAAAQRRIGLPWSERFVERAFRVVRGTCETANAALDHGVAMNLAGGTHHAFPDFGEGFCTFNMHGAKNFPFNKVKGTLDVELSDGTVDDEYLTLLAEHLPRVIRDANADLVMSLAGADPHINDRLGRLALSFEGLQRRDWMVLECCREVGIPVCVTIAGGSGRDVHDTVAVHVNTVKTLAQFAR